MTKRTGNARGTQAGNGAGGALAEVLTPLIAGMTATRTHLLEWVHTLGVGALHAVFTGERTMSRETLDEWLEAMEKTSICGLGMGAPIPVRNALRHWPELLAEAGAVAE